MDLQACNIRKRIIDMAYRCGRSVHIGGALSMVELLTVLYRDVMKYDCSNPEWEDRDIFILSKGHCVLALYALMVENGVITEDESKSYMLDGSIMGSHPVMDIAHGIECSSGSLGQGISMAVGIAKAAKLKNDVRKIYTLIGNGECDEGSVWESLMLAGQWKLDNLTVILDNNHIQSDGDSKAIIDLNNMADRLSGFGLTVYEIDGHNEDEIREAFYADFQKTSKVIVANTVKGKGISYMENNNEWHHNRLIQEFYETAFKELEVAK